jgi:hypothetical protein
MVQRTITSKIIRSQELKPCYLIEPLPPDTEEHIHSVVRPCPMDSTIEMFLSSTLFLCDYWRICTLPFLPARPFTHLGAQLVSHTAYTCALVVYQTQQVYVHTLTVCAAHTASDNRSLASSATLTPRRCSPHSVGCHYSQLGRPHHVYMTCNEYIA